MSEVMTLLNLALGAVLFILGTLFGMKLSQWFVENMQEMLSESRKQAHATETMEKVVVSLRDMAQNISRMDTSVTNLVIRTMSPQSVRRDLQVGEASTERESLTGVRIEPIPRGEDGFVSREVLKSAVSERVFAKPT